LRARAVDCAWTAGVRHFDRDFDGRLQAITDWLKTLRAPAHPLPIDAGVAAAGKTVFDRIASCHAAVVSSRLRYRGRHRGDRHRSQPLRRLDQRGGRRMNEQKLNGLHVAVSLDGIWLRRRISTTARCPAWPTCSTPARQATAFYRGYDLCDPARGGFVSQGPEAERVGWRYDTTARATATRDTSTAPAWRRPRRPPWSNT
jgi:hypothetical protein